MFYVFSLQNMARWSSLGLGRRVFIPKVTGSNPVRVTQVCIENRMRVHSMELGKLKFSPLMEQPSYYVDIRERPKTGSIA